MQSGRVFGSANQKGYYSRQEQEELALPPLKLERRKCWEEVVASRGVVRPESMEKREF